jgi:hypothetical protein
MSVFQEYLSGELLFLTPRELPNITKISDSVFAHSRLQGFWPSASLNYIGKYAFLDTNLAVINDSLLNPYCFIGDGAFDDTPIFVNNITKANVLLADGKILFCWGGNGKPSTSMAIPDSVVNISSNALSFSEKDTDFTSFTIPDTVEILGDSIFGGFFGTAGESTLNTLVVGAGVRVIGRSLVASNIKTLVFRQPTDLFIELPTPGTSDKGMAYTKDSREITIYADNECIRNYDWAADNAVVTFYPLSEAPK